MTFVEKVNLELLYNVGRWFTVQSGYGLALHIVGSSPGDQRTSYPGRSSLGIYTQIANVGASQQVAAAERTVYGSQTMLPGDLGRFTGLKQCCPVI